MVAGLVSPFAPETVLGAGNPTQVAGSTGTQSGASVVMPTVLAAAAPVAAPLAPVAASEAAAPVKVAAFVAMAEVAEKTDDASEAHVAAPPKARSHVERTSPRNSRTYRLAQRKEKAARAS